MKRFSVSVLLAAICLSLTACASVEKIFIKPVTKPVAVEVAAVTNYVPVLVPGPVQTQVVTQIVAGATIVVTNTIETTKIITNTVFIAAHTVTNDVIVAYEPNGRLTSGISTAQGLNAAFNPTPSSPIVEWSLGLITLLAAAYARFKTAQLTKTNTALAAVTEIKDTLQTAVETYPSTSTKDIKLHVNEIATAMGTQDELKTDLVAKGLSKA